MSSQSRLGLPLALLLAALVAPQLVKLMALSVGVAIPSAVAFIGLMALAAIAIAARIRFAKVIVGPEFLINALPWIAFGSLPAAVGAIRGYDESYLAQSIFYMSFVGFSVLVGANLALHSVRVYEPDSAAARVRGFTVMLAILVLGAGAAQVVTYLVFPDGFREWTDRLVDQKFLSISPYWTLLDTPLPRAFGFFQNPLSFGFVCLLLATLSWAYKQRVIMGLCLLGVLLSLTKTLLFLSGVVLFVLLLVRRPTFPKILTLQALASVTLILLIAYSLMLVDVVDLNRESYQSVLTRVETWAILWDLIRAEPGWLWSGYAITQVSTANPLGINDVDFAIDNMYLLVVLYGGVVGLFFFLWMYYYNLVRLIKGVRRAGGTEARVRRAIMSLWFVFPIWGVANALIGNLSVFYLTYVLVLIALSAERRIGVEGFARANEQCRMHASARIGASHDEAELAPSGSVDPFSGV